VHTATTSPVLDVDVTVQGPLPGAADYARARIGDLAKYTHEATGHVRVRLSNHVRSRLPNPVVAQANLTSGSRRIRAQVDAGTPEQAVDVLYEKLRRSLERRHPHWLVQRRRHRSLDPTCRVSVPRSPSRPDETAIVIRRKSFALTHRSIDSAAAELDDLDYSFHLFVDQATGCDSVLYRTGPTGYRLAETKTVPPGRVSAVRVPTTVSPSTPPDLSEQQAIDRLNAVDDPFLFFVDAATGRGAVLYRRYDGQFGLITSDSGSGHDRLTRDTRHSRRR
jgi:ribosome-associated translation inhibitor RaiA